ncbi:hypothetical protein EV2_012090 [Malus domestica]
MKFNSSVTFIPVKNEEYQTKGVDLACACSITILCEPVKGSVYIDQNNIKNYNLRQLRSHIAVVSSDLGAKAFPRNNPWQRSLH